MSQRIMIIDGNNQCHRALHAYHNLQNNGKPASIVYGMPSIITALVRQFKPDKIFICWDGGRSPFRLKLLPEYKGNRREYTDAEKKAFEDQIADVRRLFYSLGIPQLIARGIEADDWIYKLTRMFKKDKSNIITIISNDKDFHQLIRSNVRVYSTGKKILLHKKNLKVQMGYEPNKCVDFLCLTGDKSDNIAGLRGVGDVRAKGFIERFSSIENYLSNEEEDKMFNKDILEKTYKLNRQMIDLRFFYNKFLKGKMPLSYYKEANPKFNKKLLFKVCFEYSIYMFRKPEFLKTYRK